MFTGRGWLLHCSAVHWHLVPTLGCLTGRRAHSQPCMMQEHKVITNTLGSAVHCMSVWSCCCFCYHWQQVVSCPCSTTNRCCCGYHYRCCRQPPPLRQNPTVINDNPPSRPARPIYCHILQPVHHIQPLQHSTKHDVLAVQPRGVCCGNEKPAQKNTNRT